MIGHAILWVVALVLVAQASRTLPHPQGRTRAPSARGDQTYDYVIIGGGTAGNAVAARLSQSLPTAKILVIEAGSNAPDVLGINVPGLKGSTFGSQYDWNFTTAPQPDVKNRVFSWDRGKVLGGSSAINLLVYDRASSVEYDGWEQLGSSGWNWDTMLPAMEKSENFTGANTGTYGDGGVGTQGPIHSVIDRYVPAQQYPFIPTVSGLGIPTNLNSLGGNPIGVMFQPASIDPTHYNRSYSANGYLPLAGPNLAVLTDTRVAKINFNYNGSVQYATGVTLQDGSAITATREVILSAGSIQSPGLLELSGIGQSSVVAALNTTLLIELPGVGENLQDHLRVQSAYQLKSNYTSFDILRYNTTFSTEQLDKWIAGEFSIYDYSGSGFIFADWKQVVGEDSQLVALAQAAMGNSSNPVDQKKLQWLGDPAVPQVEAIFADGYTGVKGYPAPGTPLYGQGFSTLIGGLMHPLSLGSVHVDPADPLGSQPIIDPRYLSDGNYSLQGLIEIAKFLRRVARTPPLADVFVDEYEPGYDVVPLNATDDQWGAYVLNVSDTFYHPTGTCAMLPRADGGVVDSELRVYGTANLRVVDASIIPVQIAAHIQSAVYGIAERAAEMIIANAGDS